MRFKRIVVLAICGIILGLCVIVSGASLSSDNGINFVSSNPGGNVALNEKLFGITIIAGSNINVDEDIDGTVLVFGNVIDVNSRL